MVVACVVSPKFACKSIRHWRGFFSGLGPDERLRGYVVDLDVQTDGLLELTHRAVGAAPDAALDQRFQTGARPG